MRSTIAWRRRSGGALCCCGGRELEGCTAGSGRAEVICRFGATCRRFLEGGPGGCDFLRAPPPRPGDSVAAWRLMSRGLRCSLRCGSCVDFHVPCNPARLSGAGSFATLAFFVFPRSIDRAPHGALAAQGQSGASARSTCEGSVEREGWGAMGGAGAVRAAMRLRASRGAWQEGLSAPRPRQRSVRARAAGATPPEFDSPCPVSAHAMARAQDPAAEWGCARAPARAALHHLQP